MEESLERLAAAVAEGTVSAIADAAAARSRGLWLGEDEQWVPVGDSPDAPTTDAVVLDEGGHRIALCADAVTVHLVRAGLARLVAEAAGIAARSRLELNERIAGMGSYDWNILEDTNNWSDELYRIYGHEPGSFNASYEKFMELVHPDDRDRIRKIHEVAYGTGEPYEMEEHIVRPDGSVRTLWSNGAVLRDESGRPVRMVGVCRDVTDERAAEAQAEQHRNRLREAELLRRQALELNDNVVQGLTAIAWAIDGRLPMIARTVVGETLDHARAMMHELLAAAGTTSAVSGSLLRTAAAEMVAGLPQPASTKPEGGIRRCRVVLADDTADLRLLLRRSLELDGTVEIVGEAGDGQQAIEVVAQTDPDAVLLDLSMPRMDGIEACARLRAERPGLRIVVLSGWGETTMGEQAREAGADAYVQKGGSVESIVAALVENSATVG